jgi:hypothetical protein
LRTLWGMSGFTCLVDGAVVGEKDIEVMLAFASARKSCGDDGVSQWHAGVRNEAGKVYRIVHLQGLNRIVRFASLMEYLGFVDEKPLTPRKINGFDTTFRFAVRQS